MQHKIDGTVMYNNDGTGFAAFLSVTTEKLVRFLAGDKVPLQKEIQKKT
jgi:hypothetical protein